MGVKALEVAVSSGRADLVKCCYTTDLGGDEHGYILDEQLVVAKAHLLNWRWQPEMAKRWGLFRDSWGKAGDGWKLKCGAMRKMAAWRCYGLWRR